MKSSFIGVTNVSLLLATALVAQADASDWSDCASRPSQVPVDQIIMACTSIIDGGKEETEGLASALNNRGNGYWWKGELEKALEDHNRSIALRPTSALAFYNRGNDHLLLRAYDKAVADYNRALELQPGFADAYGSRGRAFIDLGRYADAVNDLSSAVAVRPSPIDYGNRGLAFFKQQQFDRAIDDANRALSIDRSLGWVQAYLQEAQDARAALLARQHASSGGNRRVALIIGNSNYLHTERLNNAANDAADVATELEKLGYRIFGYPETDMLKAEMLTRIEEFKRAAVGAQAAVVWYSGHGQEMLEEGTDVPRDWVIPVDAKINSRKDVSENALRLDQLRLSVLAAKTLRLVVIDACRTNTFWSGTRGARGMSRNEPVQGVFMVYSTQAGNVAQDGDGRNSPFAQAFLETARSNPSIDVRQFFSAVTGRTRQLVPDQHPEPVDGLGTPDTVTLTP